MATTERPTLPTAASSNDGAPVARPLSANEFNTAMAHLYRGEVARANTWRTRLDGTTNWAVLTTGATLSFAFSSPTNTHVMILLNSLLISFFLYIEARRYRYYDLWRARVRLMETEFFSDLLAPQYDQNGDHWRTLLANDLLQPHFNMTQWEAMGRRLRRNYSWIFVVLVLSWLIKIVVHPTPATHLPTLILRAGIGPISGAVVLVAGVVFNALLFVVAFGSVTRFPWARGDEVASRSQARAMMGTQGSTAEQTPQ